MSVPSDPFSPEADPYPDDDGLGHCLGQADGGPITLTRRKVGQALVLGSCALVAGCATTSAQGGASVPLACETMEDDPQACRARFCRYHRGP